MLQSHPRTLRVAPAIFLTKLFREQVLVDAVQHAIERDREAYARRAALTELRDRYQSLSPREREIIGMVVRGLLNKPIAGELGTTEATGRCTERR